MADLADYQWLTGPAAAQLMDDLRQQQEPAHRKLTRLRKMLSPERAALLASQVELRQKAATKFGDLAFRLFFTDLSLQQATDRWVAAYKASRVPSGTPIVDYCTGIGGDLLAFAGRGPTTGWDMAPELVHIASTNLAAVESDFASEVRVGMAEEQMPTPDQIWHIDPDRRSDGRRSTQIQWHSPGPELIERWLTTSPHGILKLAPAARVPDEWSSVAEQEWITRDRQCRQLVVWFGELALEPGQRRATALVAQDAAPTTAASFVGRPNAPAPLASEIADFLYDTDPSIRAAGLTGAIAAAHDLATVGEGAVYLTGKQPVDHPLLTRFQVLEILPLRVKTLSKHLHSLKVGQLEIKKRGVTTQPEQLRKQLKLRGEHSATLLLTRLGASEVAVLAKRC